MGYVEARNGRWGIYGDIVWGKFDFSGETVRQRNPIANLNVIGPCQCRIASSALRGRARSLSRDPARSNGSTLSLDCACDMSLRREKNFNFSAILAALVSAAI